MDTDRRFGGIAALYGRAGLDRLRQAHVAVIGVGGVGSWVVEALARSALGHLTLVDLDHVAESNINRQLAALTETLGRAKIEVLAERVASINPAAAVHLIDDFVAADNVLEPMVYATLPAPWLAQGAIRHTRTLPFDASNGPGRDSPAAMDATLTWPGGP
jgi:tRNA A37 threonylcarbamoyladenosine dehydratase